jgi:hypothetical protein
VCRSGSVCGARLTASEPDRSRQTFAAAMIRMADALPHCVRVADTLKTTTKMRSLNCWVGHASTRKAGHHANRSG